MKIVEVKAKCYGIKISMRNKKGKEVGRTFLFIMYNGLHKKPFGLMEDVYVMGKMRGKGLGTELVIQVIKIAREKGCYKLIATSRYSRTKVHDLYTKLGFHDQGKEFRMDF
ncbi:MAG: GNAT family N-acetyltransferase [Patescibacteria group bacterium]|nr:GNAT family N-acetyltransferase [Patescibacteria group bacterium]MDD5490313.1 GNAT family N-acetyltransferase [Patescibacteria group bacterium]